MLDGRIFLSFNQYVAFFGSGYSLPALTEEP
jgi:hypothetical protein